MSGKPMTIDEIKTLTRLEILNDALHMQYGMLNIVSDMREDLKNKSIEISIEIEDIKRQIKECGNDQ